MMNFSLISYSSTFCLGLCLTTFGVIYLRVFLLLKVPTNTTQVRKAVTSVLPDIIVQ